MSNIMEKFVGNPTAVEIDGVKINVYPMTVEDMLLFRAGLTPEETLNNNCELVRRCLKDEVLSIEDVKKIRQDVFTLILDKIDEVSNSIIVKDESAIRKLKEKIARVKGQKEDSSNSSSS